jgi:HSP20 family protein
MGFFDEDPFEEIVRDFFGEKVRGGRVSRRSDFVESEEQERTIDFIEKSGKLYVVFELPGYDKEDIDVAVKDNILSIRATKKCSECVESYIAKRLNSGIRIQKTLPKMVNTKKFDFSFKNGILEVVFDKK